MWSKTLSNYILRPVMMHEDDFRGRRVELEQKHMAWTWSEQECRFKFHEAAATIEELEGGVECAQFIDSINEVVRIGLDGDESDAEQDAPAKRVKVEPRVVKLETRESRDR